ncbi:hypothetical protein RND81_07G116700 [Saponaria officinalis]|uniref:F-box domain-containing protein n=1 Tax=Saponaria officinalis TaxID=3572 RepID=A0AAW1JRL6_SAPOF
MDTLTPSFSSPPMEETWRNEVLPDDILTQILTYVPPKPLTRFKLVSKSFLTLINHPTFLHLHLHRHRHRSSTTSLAAIHHSSSTLTLHTLHLPTPNNSISPEITKLPLPFTPKTSPPNLIGSCHGIVCVSAFPDFVALVNPVTRTFHNMAFPPLHPDGYTRSHWVVFGFGFDEFDADFRVLRVDQVHNLGGEELVGPREAQVFSLKSNSWKKVDDFPYFLSHPMSHGKYFCNSLHWIATTTHPAVFNITGLLWRGRLDDFVYDYVLVVFDLHLDKFRVLPLPDYGVDDLVVPRLSVGVLGECLFVQVEHGARFKRCVDVWVMREYGVKESWIKLLSFPYMEVRRELLPITTLALSSRGNEVLMQLGEECFWLEVGSGKITDVVIDGGLPFLLELISGHTCCFGAVLFVESLVCLSCRLEAGDVKKNSNGQKKRGGLLSSRFKLK